MTYCATVDGGRKAVSVSALSSSSLDSESTQSSKKYPSTFTLSSTGAGPSGTGKQALQEPDVIASTKPKQKPQSSAPVAPPRYKKKSKKLNPLALAVSVIRCLL